MDQIRLFRRRFLPDEKIELKDDIILYSDEKLIVTSWKVLRPRKDIARGVSAYFIADGIKVSKVYDTNDELVYWYCDIIDSTFDESNHVYTFNDLLVDVLVYPDGHVEVVDLDEFADIIKLHILPEELQIKTLQRTNRLLQTIYSGNFSKLTDEIEKYEI